MELSWQLGDEGPHHAVLASLSSQCDVDEEVEVGYEGVAGVRAGRGGCGLGAAMSRRVNRGGDRGRRGGWWRGLALHPA